MRISIGKEGEKGGRGEGGFCWELGVVGWELIFYIFV